jgi:hypothetical protein
MIAFHRAFEMGHERRAFDGQVVVVFHGLVLSSCDDGIWFSAVIAGLDPAIHHLPKESCEGDGCAGQARA